MSIKISSRKRILTYAQAINEAFHLMMKKDRRVFVMGVGVNSPWFVGQTMVGLSEKFGEERVIDSPVAENGITGIAIGAAIAGMRPVMVHPRMDFMYLAMDQIVNHGASWSYMFGGKVNVPVTIRGIINRGGEQAAQHSQNLAAIFTHIPGLKVVMPSTAYDAKGLLIASIMDNNPVIYIDDRWLYKNEDEVPEGIYKVEIGKAKLRQKGNDITVTATSYLVNEALAAGKILKKDGISLEVIDLRSVKPLDEEMILKSVKKTGRLLIADSTWQSCGLAAEITAIAATKAFKYLRGAVIRLTLPNTPAPASSSLENEYYPKAEDIVLAAKKMIKRRKNGP